MQLLLNNTSDVSRLAYIRETKLYLLLLRGKNKMARKLVATRACIQT